MKPMRLSPRVAFWALAGATLLVSHDAIWLVQIGPGEQLATALRVGGHDYWGPASLALAVAGVAVAMVAGLRLLALHRRARPTPARRQMAARRPYLARVGAAWLRLLVVVALGFAIQENLEHALAHGHVPGLGALMGPEYPLALPLIASMTLLAALLAAAVTAAEALLLARIATTLRLRRAPRRLRRPSPLVRRPWAASPRLHASRAPPSLLVQS